jgi:HlyD family secretion protein
MFRKYVLPIAAAALLAFAVFHVVSAQPNGEKVTPPVTPARTPFDNTVAGSGIVEARSENISVGSHLPGVAVEVFVKVGQKVKAGDPLFRLDDRQLQAELKVREANVAATEAQLSLLHLMPRPEEVPPSQAKVREAEANLANLEDQRARARTLFAKKAIGEEELIRSEQTTRVAREQLARARADYALLQSGAWEADKAVTRATLEQAKAQVEQTKTELERLTVRALADGEVLQVNVRPGEFVGAPPNQTLIVLGEVRKLHVRVDIDEHDIPRFRPGLPARAMLRGSPRAEYPMTFVRVEPYVVPKKSLTGDNTERVDTRVLQVIYALDAKDQTFYVGQQMDVFLDAAN